MVIERDMPVRLVHLAITDRAGGRPAPPFQDAVLSLQSLQAGASTDCMQTLLGRRMVWCLHEPDQAINNYPK